jgi:hypothetical protein
MNLDRRGRKRSGPNLSYAYYSIICIDGLSRTAKHLGYLLLSAYPSTLKTEVVHSSETLATSLCGTLQRCQWAMLNIWLHIIGWFLNDVWGMIWQEVVVAWSKRYHSICLGRGLRNSIKNLSHGSQFSCLDSEWRFGKDQGDYATSVNTPSTEALGGTGGWKYKAKCNSLIGKAWRDAVRPQNATLQFFCLTQPRLRAVGTAPLRNRLSRPASALPDCLPIRNRRVALGITNRRRGVPRTSSDKRLTMAAIPRLKYVSGASSSDSDVDRYVTERKSLHIIAYLGEWLRRGMDWILHLLANCIQHLELHFTDHWHTH